MKICFLGLENLPVLAPQYNQHGIGGEQVQHTLLAKALVRRGHSVSMVVLDYGQADGAAWDRVFTYKAYRATAGIPVLRYVYPRWTGVWSALRRADADVYYVSCAGMHLGLLALFCKKYKRKLVFKIAHDTDCEPDKLLVRYWRDKKLYEYGLRHANGILAQSLQQQKAMQNNYGLHSHLSEMLVDAPEKPCSRSMDVLWVNNLRQFKRPDVFLELAKLLPQYNFHMIGGPQPGFGELFEQISQEAAAIPNFTFHGRVPYHDMDSMYAGARVFVNTSDNEGFPNSYLQAWIRGTPVVAFFDPDGLIQRESLGCAVISLDQMGDTVRTLVDSSKVHEIGGGAALDDQGNNAWLAASMRCKAYMEQVYGEERILAPYLTLFQGRGMHGA
jgi:glycosyltransferase involved in cell wall biosynthesis